MREKVIIENIEQSTPTKTKEERRDEIMTAIDAALKAVEQIPQHAMGTSLNHYDYVTIMMLIKSVLKLT